MKDDLKAKGFRVYATNQYYGWAAKGKGVIVGEVSTADCQNQGTTTCLKISPEGIKRLKTPGQERLYEKTGSGDRPTVLEALKDADKVSE